jgi:hypothetical protein
MFKHSDNINPNNLSLREIILSKESKDSIHLIQFAECIKDLWDKEINVKEKLYEYSQTSLKENTIIDEDKFLGILFELLTANFFSSKCLKIEFIKERKKKKTPKIKIISLSGTVVFLECKRKKFKEVYRKKDLLDPIRDTNEKLEEMNEIGILYLLLPFDTYKTREQQLLKKYDDYIFRSLKDFHNVNFVILVSQSMSKEGEFIKKNLSQKLIIENSDPKIEPTREIFELLLTPSLIKKGLRSLLD